MNPPELIQLASEIELDRDEMFTLRVRFAIACIERVEHLLTDRDVRDTLAVGKSYAADQCSDQNLQSAATRAAELARSHPGSNSIDGTGSAAVTTSFGVAAALAGNALQAAGYAAYASVYSYASHAVTDVSAYKPEHDWQTNKLRELLNTGPAA